MSYDLDLDLENTCRVCLTPSDKLLNLFTTQIVDGYVKTMPAMVHYCLDIVIDDNDILPRKICASCKTTIIRYFAFKHKCKRTEEVWNEVLLEAGHAPNIREGIVQYHTSLEYKKAVHSNKEFADETLESIEQEGTIIEEQDEVIVVDDEKIEETGLERETKFDDTQSKKEFAVVLFGSMEQHQIVMEEKNVEVVMEEESKFDDYFVNTDHIYVKVRKEAANVDFNSCNVIPENEAFESMDTIEEHLTEEIATENETLQDDDSEEYLCTFCDKVFEGVKYLEHCKKEHFMCPDCHGTYDTIENLDEHKKVDHKLPVTEIPSNLTEQKSSEGVFCDLCNKRWSGRKYLNRHMKLHEVLNSRLGDFVDGFKCEHCRTVYLRSEDLEKHTCMTNDEEIDEDAIGPDYKYISKFKPKTTNDLICGVCKATYPNMEHLRNHMIIHFDSFCCPFDACGCEYFAFERLAMHIMKKHAYGEELFCPHCREKRFDTYDLLQEHIRDECSAEKFACDCCDKQFVRQSSLKQHMRLHEKIIAKKFQCSLCEKTFVDNGERITHMRSHTGERPFKCTICSKSYKTGSHRAAHMDVHIDGKIFQCTICDKKFQSKRGYRTHMKQHVHGRKHKCHLCDKQFFSKNHLNRHVLNLHQRIKAKS